MREDAVDAMGSNKRMMSAPVRLCVQNALRREYLPYDAITAIETAAKRMIEGYENHLLTVERIFHTDGACSSHVFALFKSRFGLTPRCFLEQARFLSAYFHLAMGFSVKEAAEASGFFLEKKLRRACARQLGCSPQRIRRECGADFINMINTSIGSSPLHGSLPAHLLIEIGSQFICVR